MWMREKKRHRRNADETDRTGRPARFLSYIFRLTRKERYSWKSIPVRLCSSPAKQRGGYQDEGIFMNR